MEKDVLSQYSSQKREIRDLERMIEDAQKKKEKYRNLIVSDSVKGTRPDGTYGPIKVTGPAKKYYQRQEHLLLQRQEKMQKLKLELEKMTLGVETYIASIPDSKTRRILRYRVIEDLSWQQVALKMGGKETADSCRMIFKRFIEKEQPGI
jgi:hypothetical protein